MKLTQYTIIHGLLGLVVLVTIGLFYALLVPHGQSSLSPLTWTVFIAAALALGLVAFAPSLLRRWRGLAPPPPMSAADIKFSIVLVAVLCPIAFWAVWLGGAYGSMAMILVPLAFLFRFRSGSGSSHKR